MKLLREYDFHDAFIIKFSIKRIRRHYRILINISTFNDEKIQIIFNKVEEYLINLSNKEQYIIEIENYNESAINDEEKIHMFKLQGNGLIKIKSKEVKINTLK